MSTNKGIAVLAIALLPGVVLAGVPIELQPVEAVYEQVQKTCAEALRDAQFLRELMKTDGDTSPELPPVGECHEQSQNT